MRAAIASALLITLACASVARAQDGTAQSGETHPTTSDTTQTTRPRPRRPRTTTDAPTHTDAASTTQTTDAPRTTRTRTDAASTTQTTDAPRTTRTRTDGASTTDAPARPRRRRLQTQAATGTDGSTTQSGATGSQDATDAAPRRTDTEAPIRTRPRPRPTPVEAPSATPIVADQETITPSAPQGGESPAQTPQVPTEQPVPPAAPLDGGVPELDAGALELDAGPALEPDAGPPPTPDAGPPPEPDAGGVEALPAPLAEGPTPPSGQHERDFLGALSEWMWEQRAERESAERETARRGQTPAEAAPEAAPQPDEVQVVLNDSLREWLGFALPERRFSSFGILVLLGLAFLGLLLLDRLRRPLPERGIVPRALGALHLVVRLATVVLVLMFVSRLLPSWLHPALLLTVAAVAVALGFGAVWVLLPDVVGGVVLLTEGRLRPGQWIVGEGFAGTVEQVGPRVTVLRAPDGALLTVPNRRVVKSPVHATDRRWHEVEVQLRAPSGVAAGTVREAIRDAVLCSPYIPPDPRVTLSRDPIDPERWRLKVRLLDVRFTAAFEGQLLERVEEIVARNAAR